MNACGIIVEYNPFHNGHIYHIQKAKEVSNCDLIIAVISGNFVQRGERAVVDKWQRASAALSHGVDLVIELPFIYSTQSAMHFAEGAVTLLDLAKVQSLVFGSESNNLEELKMIASLSINPDHLKESMKSGISFPKAYGLWANEYQPNDILGIAYCRALKNKDILPFSIQRTTAYHQTDFEGNIASATAIRHALFQNQDIKNVCPMDLSLSDQITLKDYWPLIRTLLLTRSSSELSALFLFDEGIENHFKKQADLCLDYDELLNNLITKRYTRSRIQRTLLQLLMNNTKKEVHDLPPLDFIRPLAFNDKGREYLKELKGSGVKIASRFNKIPLPYRRMEYKAAVLYSCLSKNPTEQTKKEIQGPIYRK